MEAHEILKSKYLDILYDGRNKHYGGYELRTQYARRVRMSLALLLGITLCGTGYLVLAEKTGTERVVHFRGTVDLTPIVSQQPIKPKPLPARAPAVVSKPTVKFPPPKIVADAAEQSALKNSIAGLYDKDGDSTATGITSVDIKPVTGVVNWTAEKGPERYVEQMPEAPYDINNYLAHNINYPAAARENNIEGQVNIQFVVNEDGSITM